YRDLARHTCNRSCAGRWRDAIGSGLQRLARLEIGGDPTTHPRAYAQRSPLSYARSIASSGVQLQLWWSKADRVVQARDQSVPLVRALRRLNPSMSLQTFVG